MTRYLRPAAHRILPPLAAAAVLLLSFTAVAHAASAVEPKDGSLLDLLQPVLDAFRGGDHLLAGASALVVAVALARRYFTSAKSRWVLTEAGSAGLALAGSFGATLTAQLTAGASPSLATARIAFGIAFAAVGGYAVLKALVVKPYVENLADKGPNWLHAPLKIVLWIFQHMPVEAPPAAEPAAPVPAPAPSAPTPAAPVPTPAAPPAGPAVPPAA